ncbi:MAG TPA: hypothetical protein VD971_05930 [Phycisphaerales bacterium]|nr:hypothetical protein [Phycisphaerales bacterium]
MRRRLLLRLGIPPDISTLVVDEMWRDRMQLIDGVRVDTPGLDWKALFKRLGITLRDKVYYWGADGVVREYGKDVLIPLLGQVWNSYFFEDTDIFDESMDWDIAILHTGEVGVIWPMTATDCS